MIVVSGIALLLVLALYRALPRSAAAGRWVWPLPALVFALTFIGDATSSGLKHALTVFFHPGPNGEAAWVLMLVTDPTCSEVVYSLVMLIAHHKARERIAAKAIGPAREPLQQ